MGKTRIRAEPVKRLMARFGFHSPNNEQIVIFYLLGPVKYSELMEKLNTTAERYAFHDAKFKGITNPEDIKHLRDYYLNDYLAKGVYSQLVKLPKRVRDVYNFPDISDEQIEKIFARRKANKSTKAEVMTVPVRISDAKSIDSLTFTVYHSKDYHFFN